MPRLIDIEDAKACAPSLRVEPGDLLVFTATGGRVTGGEALRLVGAFVRAVIGTNGAVLEPMGPPNAVAFAALQPGDASIEVIGGDPFGRTDTTTLRITVDGPP